MPSCAPLAQALVALALRGRAPDNVSAVVITVGGDGAPRRARRADVIGSSPPRCYASIMPCTCPPAVDGSRAIARDPRCPEHGLSTLRIPELLHFEYEDGIQIHAENQAAADEMHAAMAARRRQTPKA